MGGGGVEATAGTLTFDPIVAVRAASRRQTPDDKHPSLSFAVISEPFRNMAAGFWPGQGKVEAIGTIISALST